MNLNYNILWFEDDKSSFEAKKEIVRNIIDDLGFHFQEPRNEIDGTNIGRLNFEDYDLIIVDLNLSRSEKGSDLIERVRQMDVYTEVVFYSSSGERAVREELKKHEIDGVYCADRNNEDFEDKVKKVIKTTVKKLQDINNLRGLVLAETSELDSKLVDLILLFLEKDAKPEEKSKELLGKTLENRNERLKKLKKIVKVDKEYCMCHLEAYDKWRAITRLIGHRNKVHKKKMFSPYDEVLKLYSKEIIDMRNILAHAKEESDGNGNKFLRSNYNKKTVDFTHDICVDIRKQIRKHANNLDSIYNII